jgi:hypothetical protein
MGLDESELPEDGGEVERSRRSSGVKVFFYWLMFGQGIWQGLAPAALSSTIVLRQREIYHATFNSFVFT